MFAASFILPQNVFLLWNLKVTVMRWLNFIISHIFIRIIGRMHITLAYFILSGHSFLYTLVLYYTSKCNCDMYFAIHCPLFKFSVPNQMAYEV